MRSIAQYALLEPLGHGAMSVVYRAHDNASGRHCAIKILDAKLAENAGALTRFLGEARTLLRVRHPNVVEIFDVGSDAEHYMAMELLSGQPLSSLLTKGPLALSGALTLAADLAGALAAVHDAGIVHRDVKPDNLMVTSEGVLKLIDFGVARAAADMNVMHTQAGVVLGTPAYMAPEQVCGKPVDARADIYSFGAVLYEMLTGVLAFAADNFGALLVEHLTVRPPRPSEVVDGVPASLDALVAQCLAKDPEARPANMDEVEVRLRHVQAFSHATAPLRRRGPRRLWRSRAAAVGVVILLSVGGWRVAHHRQAPAMIPTLEAAEPLPPQPVVVATTAVAPPTPPPPAKKIASKKPRKRTVNDADLIDAFAR